VFFPMRKDTAAPALSYCKVCPVREVCLAWAIQMGERYGVWGGTTEQQRNLLIPSSATSPEERIIDLR
jgi:WhiB family redox-sensing transcriptional regulator